MASKLRHRANFAAVKQNSRRLLPGLRALLPGLLLALSACQKADDVPAPPQLVPANQMVRLLVDLHTLEARTDGAGLPPDSTRALFRQEQKKIYWRYEVTDSTFQQSYRYYAIHDQDLDAIYATVIDSLALREARRQQPGDVPAPGPPR